jgi:hypothetical protein
MLSTLTLFIVSSTTRSFHTLLFLHSVADRYQLLYHARADRLHTDRVWVWCSSVRVWIGSNDTNQTLRIPYWALCRTNIFCVKNIYSQLRSSYARDRMRITSSPTIYDQASRGLSVVDWEHIQNKLGKLCSVGLQKQTQPPFSEGFSYMPQAQK